MDGFGAIIDLFGGSSAFASAMGVAPSHARVMKARDSIPPAYWPSLVAVAKRRGMGITYEDLALLRQKRWPRRRDR